LKDSYSENGRPSIDPELRLGILLVGYLYGITSERKLAEEQRMHLAWRCSRVLGFDQDIRCPPEARIPAVDGIPPELPGTLQVLKPLTEPRILRAPCL